MHSFDSFNKKNIAMPLYLWITFKQEWKLYTTACFHLFIYLFIYLSFIEIALLCGTFVDNNIVSGDVYVSQVVSATGRIKAL